RLVVGIEQPAAIDREATATNARRETVPKRLQRFDALVQIPVPAPRKPLPVAPRRRSAGRERVERSADLIERYSRGLARLDQRDSTENCAVVAALVAARPA